jgi:hypothetical protein
MLRPLLIMAAACQIYFFLITVMRMRALLFEARQRGLAGRRAGARPRAQAAASESTPDANRGRVGGSGVA